MTIEELQKKQDKITDGIYQGQMRSYTNEHLTNLTIEYAISVLENARQQIISDSTEENPLSPAVRMDITMRKLQSLIKQ